MYSVPRDTFTVLCKGSINFLMYVISFKRVNHFMEIDQQLYVTLFLCYICCKGKLTGNTVQVMMELHKFLHATRERVLNNILRILLSFPVSFVCCNNEITEK